jgi:carbonic anhydrase
MLGVIAFLISSLALANGIDFSYFNQSAWPAEHCNGKRQSPIDIVTSSLKTNSSLVPLNMSSTWGHPFNGTWLNNGHTLRFDFDINDLVNRPITIVTHHGLYQVVQFHLHWGRGDTTGSENTVDGRAYSGELHFVHTRLSSSNPISGNAFAVIAVFLQSDSSIEFEEHWGKLNSNPSYEAMDVIESIVPSGLLPSSLDYYHYEGSLTTPYCNESVQWFVLKEVVSVPAGFFTTLRSIEDSHNGTLTYNYRDVQPLNGRAVYQYTGSSTIAIAPVVMMILFMAITMIIN